MTCIGILKLKLKSFRNSHHKLHDGSCCDNSFTSCSNPCDNYFKKICLTSPSGTNCGIGKSKTGVIGVNQDVISFGAKVASLSNPIVYSFAKWEVSFFKVAITLSEAN